MNFRSTIENMAGKMLTWTKGHIQLCLMNKYRIIGKIWTKLLVTNGELWATNGELWVTNGQLLVTNGDLLVTNGQLWVINGELWVTNGEL